MKVATKQFNRKMGTKTYLKQNWSLYTMILPAILFFLVFAYYPMLGLQIAFKDFKFVGGIWDSPWAADPWYYFKQIFSDPEILTKMVNTLRLSSLRIVCGFPMPIIMVVLLNEMRGKLFKKSVQTLTYLPHFISWVIIANIFFQLTKDTSPLQAFFRSVFGKNIHFFNDPKLFIGMLIVTDIWKECGWSTIIYLAAISGIDPALEEAAQIDGANRMQRIIHIILPGLVPAISINLIFALSGIVYGGFDQVFNLMGENSVLYPMADILETYIYRIGIAKQNSYSISLTTALGMFNSSIALVLVLAANFIVKRLGGNAIW